ncbi:MAG: AraC family transcriptional regulator [bacterium]|nr:AraC family transcriptional regulator [bacterium]
MTANPIALALTALAFTGLCHALYLALGQLLQTARNTLIARLYFGVAFIFLDVLVVTTSPPEWIAHMPALSFWFALPRFWLGPLAFAYFAFMITDPRSDDFPETVSGDSGSLPGWKQLLPGTLILAIGSLLMLIDFASLIAPGLCSPACETIQDTVTRRVSRALIITAGNLHIAAYLLPSVISAVRLFVQGQSKTAALTAALLGLGALSAAACQAFSSLPEIYALNGEATGTADSPFQSFAANSAGIVGISLLLIALYAVGLLGLRFPRFLQSLRLEARRMNRQRENRLGDLSPERLQQNLDELMETEKIYQDEDLRLSTVASLLDLSPHQLSYYLNQILEIDFAGYVNRYRIRDAEEALRSSAHSSRSVLEIGLQAGFNSKTAFYRAFGEATGMSPSKYRNEHGSKH